MPMKTEDISMSCAKEVRSPIVGILLEENGQKKIDVAWSELDADDLAKIIDVIDKNWDLFNKMIDDVFAGKKITIKKFDK